MSRRHKYRPARNWKEVEYRLGRPKTVGTMITFAAIWALTGFNPWVAFGLSISVLSMAGFFGGKYKHSDKEYWSGEYNGSYDDDDNYDDDDDYNSANENKYENQSLRPTAAKPSTELRANTGTAALHNQIIKDAAEDIEHLRAASTTASDDLGIHLRNMVSNVEKVQKGLEEDPNKLSQVQRLFTYYLPSTTDLLKARGRAAAIGDTKKLAEIDAMIDRLEDAFEDFAARINGEDARSVEIDIRLLDQSLAQEFSHIEKDKV